MKKYLVLGVFTVLFAISLSEAENAKIKLPDGLYMYDSSIERLTDGRERVGFGKYFVAKNNTIYSAQEAVRKFGVSKLNKLFTENKKYKILFGGEKLGKIYDVKIDDEGDWNYREELLTKNIKEGPAYWKESIYLDRLGSAVKCLAVPEEYKEVKKKVYTAIPQEEIDKVAKLAKDKLLPLVINRKELKRHKIKDTELYKEDLMLLDKISYPNNNLYIGVYRYMFKIQEYFVAFAIFRQNLYVITSNYDDVTYYDGNMSIQGTLDVDGSGDEGLIIEKQYLGPGEVTANLEVYKQKKDGNWTRIQKLAGR